jgi:hypothetical protein
MRYLDQCAAIATLIAQTVPITADDPASRLARK